MFEIDRQQRDVLWEDAECALTGAASDLHVLTERADEGDLHIRARLDTAMHLLDDLGWQRDDPRERFYLTLSVERLRPWLAELDRWALDCLHDDAAALRDPAKEFAQWLEHTDEKLEDLREGVRRSADEHLEAHTAAAQMLALVEAA
jgi:hypothetical protein